MKLLAAEIIVALNELHFSSVNLTAAKRMAQTALAAVQQAQLGYAVIGAVKPAHGSQEIVQTTLPVGMKISGQICQ